MILGTLRARSGASVNGRRRLLIVMSRSLVILAATLFCVGVLSAQAHDSKGKKFWVAFLDNVGSGGDAENSDLRLYISCDRPTKAYITYLRTNQRLDVDIPEPNEPIEIDISLLFGPGVELAARDRGVTSKTLMIEADDDVTLYGVNIRQMSADAFLGLPDDVLTRRYIVLAYPNGYNASAFPTGYDMPSEFAVIAIENGTEVRITPSATLNNRSDLSAFTVKLDSGQVYFAQADLTGLQDVSGTELLATKPIALFAGNRRTSIPTNVGNFRDHLVEQIPPLEAWGTEALITPHFNITPESPYTAVVRVLGAFDGTNWELNGVAQPPLRAAKSVEIPLRQAPMVIKADQPILVAQYEHSVGDITPGSGTGYALGDPFMMLIPPAEQFDTAYAFQCVNHPEFLAHFVNIVIPNAAIPSIRLDGMPLTQTFSPIPGSGYSYTQAQLNPGAHFVRADSAFGLYAYGYGRANSYGYPGGTLFRTLVNDFQAPEINPDFLCGRIAGVAYDSRITDTGIDSCYATDATRNAVLTIEPFVPGVDSVRFQGTLIDPYQDGRVGVKAIDSGGRSMIRVLDIPGFTLRAVGMSDSSPLVTDTLVVFNGREFCSTIQLENYGAFERTITKLSFGETVISSLRIDAPLPIVLQPGEKRSVNICYNGNLDTVYTAQLLIGAECIDRQVARIPIISRIDSLPPGVVRSDDPCLGDYDLSISEPRNLASGVASVEFEELVNCVGTVTPDKTSFPVPLVTTKLRRVDPRQDMIYRIRMRDVIGNEQVIADTIGGFTVAVTESQGEPLGIRVDREWVGDSLVINGTRCDSLVIGNYGLRTLTLRSVRTHGNLSYSIPPSQLPIVLQSGERRRVGICIEGRTVGEQLDSLIIEGGCGLDEIVVMKTNVALLSGVGRDLCNNSLSIQMFGPTKRTFMTHPTPNPAGGGAAYVDIGLKEKQDVTLEVLGLDGAVAAPILDRMELGAGISRVEFDVSRMPSGAYFCRLVTASGEVFVRKLVVGR